MNEKLYYEPAYEPVADALVAEPDYLVPEYINPEWDDDALYNLICANQEVLVDVGGDTMTLSAAMNQHPGPWTPENEANLIAYAEGLLADALIKPEVPAEEIPEEAENEPIPDQQIADDPPILKVEQQVEADGKPESIEPQQVKDIPPQADTPIVVPEPTTPTFATAAEKARSKIIDPPRKVEVKSATVKLDKVPDVVMQIAEPDDPTDRAEQTEGSASIKEVEEPRISEDSQPEELESLEEAELATADDIEPDIEYGQADEAVAEKPVVQQVFESENEVIRSESELTVDEIPIGSPLDRYVDLEEADQANAIEYDQLEQVVIADEVEDMIRQLEELIMPEDPEHAEETNVVLNKIFEAPTNLAIETKEEWVVFYVEIFEAAGIACTPELIERLSALTVERNLFDEIEGLYDAGYVTPEGEDGSTRMMIKKLLVAIVSIIQAIRNVFTIGTYALRLSLAS